MAKNIFRGNTTVNNIYRGNTPLSKVYKGNTEIWASAAEIPVTADAFNFLASTYSGTGDWEDSVVGYGGALQGSPTFNSDGNSSYWELSGANNNYFLVPAADRTNPSGKVFDTQNVSGTGEGAVECVFYMDTYSSNALYGLLSMWNSSGSLRELQLTIMDNGDYGFFMQCLNGNVDRTFRVISATTGVSTGVWSHVVFTWDFAANSIKAYLNAVEDGNTTFTDSSSAFNLANGNCIAIGGEVQNCGSGISGRFFDGRMAAFRGYNSALTTSEISSLYSYWGNFFTF